jgi:molybdopterin converting factor small subunit
VKIYIKAYGFLQRYLNDKKEAEFCLEQGSTVINLFRKLKKTKSDTWMVVVNGKIATENTILNDGDVVTIFEPIAGGTCTRNLEKRTFSRNAFLAEYINIVS